MKFRHRRKLGLAQGGLAIIAAVQEAVLACDHAPGSAIMIQRRPRSRTTQPVLSPKRPGPSREPRSSARLAEKRTLECRTSGLCSDRCRSPPSTGS
eukprot:7376707-Heterocapsa_arctica.AAC.1